MLRRILVTSAAGAGIGLGLLVCQPRTTYAGDGVTCLVTPSPKERVQVKFDYGNMAGLVTVDGAKSTRRIRIKAVPHAAIYSLVFTGYDAGDQKPASESMAAGKAVVARLVAYGETNHLFFDSDFHPDLSVAASEFTCQ